MTKKKERIDEHIVAIANSDLELFAVDDPVESLALVLTNATKTKLRNLLDSLIKNKRLEQSDDLTWFLSYLKSTYPSYTIKDGVLKKVIKPNLEEPQFSFFQSLVEWLCDPWNLKRVGKCSCCGRYYLAQKADKRIKYCSSDCKNKVTNTKMKDNKAESQRRRREIMRRRRILQETTSRIKHMRGQGVSQKEAEQIARGEAEAKYPSLRRKVKKP
jgi:hypothetical protein